MINILFFRRYPKPSLVLGGEINKSGRVNCPNRVIYRRDKVCATCRAGSKKWPTRMLLVALQQILSRIYPYVNRLNGQKAGLAEVTKSVACRLRIEKGVLASLTG